MKKVILLMAVLAIGAPRDVHAQWWSLSGNAAVATDNLGTTNLSDLRIITNNLPRARVTYDGNWDFGNNGFTSSTICGIFGQGNNTIGSGMSFIGGMGNMYNTANACGILGQMNNVTGSSAIVALGGGNMVDSSNESVVAGEDLHLIGGHGCFMAGGHSTAIGRYHISLGRQININGNNIHAYGDQLSNDLDFSLAMGFNNNRTMVLTDRGVSIQMNPSSPSTPAPGHNLEVDADPSSGGGGVGSNIAFINLPYTNAKFPYIIVNPSNGELYLDSVRGGGGPGISNSCITSNIVPKSDAAGNLNCSQIYDDGLSVGINKTSGFGYVAGSGVFIAGAPASQIVRLDVNGLTRSISFVATSDAKFKSNISTLKSSLDNVLQLRGVEYNWNTTQFPSKQFDHLKHSGFIAQELMEVLPNAVIKDENGDYAVDYNSIIPVLAEAIKEQQKQIEDLKAQTQNSNKSATGIESSTTKIAGAFLAQNVPNPFSVATEIKYQLPQKVQKAYIGLYDMNGKEIKLFQLSGKQTSGFVSIQGGDLMPGMYLYSLVIDGQYFDSKKMVLTSQ